MEILIQNVSYITWQMLVMWTIGGLLIYLAIEKDMEPTLLLPMGFGGIMVAKLMNLFSREKINPMIGAAGISAFPMSARVVHKMGLEEDNSNFLLMHSIGVNVSGQIASVIAGGLILALVKAQIGG